jgi:hypothetical protein
MKLLIMAFSSLPCYVVPLRAKNSPQHPILKQPQPTFLPQCPNDQVSHPYKTIENNDICYNSYTNGNVLYKVGETAEWLVITDLTRFRET